MAQKEHNPEDPLLLEVGRRNGAVQPMSSDVMEVKKSIRQLPDLLGKVVRQQENDTQRNDTQRRIQALEARLG